MVASKKKTTFKSLTARLLILGDKQVGKSASIVRYTTGRYIEQYSQTTNDWLYRHSLGFDAKQNSTTSVELLEQKDIHFLNSSNFFASSTSLNSNSNNNNNYSNYIETITNNRMKNCNDKISNNLSDCYKQQQSLASRVALDQQIDNEMHEKQQLLNKLHWANAYIVIYAINDINTFNKAIKYLNLIANNINSPLDNNHRQSSNSNSLINNNSGSSSSSSCSNVSPNSNYNNIIINNTHSNCNGLFNRLSPINSHKATSKLSPNHHHHHHHHSNNCNCNYINLGTNNLKRPILLLANKRDLGKGNARQVSSIDGRMLAMRHQAMFVELSIAESNKLIESTINSFIDQIDLTGMQIDYLGSSQQQQLLADIESQPKLVQWCPEIHISLNQSASIGNSSPVWATLVKSQAVGSSIAQSNRVTPTRHEIDIRLIKPIGLVAKSVETSNSIKPLLATSKMLKGQSMSSSKLISSAKTKPTCYTVRPNQKLVNSNKYENLKSSFRRASMAIVSGKTLAKSLTKITSKQPEKDLNEGKRNGDVFQSVCSFDSISEPLVEPNTRRVSTNSAPGPTNWIKSHIRLNRIDQQKPVTASSSDPKLNSSELLTTEKIKKPVLKYKNRAQTGLFKRILDEDSYNDSGSIIRELEQPEALDHYKQTEFERYEEGRTNSSGSCGYTSTRCSSGRSSSSLSNTDTPFGSSFLSSNSEKVRLSLGSASVGSSSHSGNHQVKQLDRCNSRSTLSTASTFEGSCEETSGDEILTNSNTTINSRVFLKAGSQRIDPPKQALPSLVNSVINVDNNNNVKRKQLVKSVQGTLTNLTRSSNLVAKKSFCSALFGHSIIDATAPVKITSIPAIKQK